MNCRQRVFVFLSLVFVFSFCHPVQANEILELKNRIQQLEAENSELKNKLIRHKIPLEEQFIPDKSLASLAGVAPEKKALVKGGFIDFNYYHTNQDNNTFTINALANIGDWQYFQLLNMDSPINAEDPFNLTSYFTEIHLRHPINKHNAWLKAIDWTIMYADGSSAKDLVRLGARIRFKDLPGPVGDFFRDKLGLMYAMNLWPYESDGEGVQIEHVYYKKLFDGLFYLSGFGDQNIDSTGMYWVSEHQVGLRIIDNFYLIHETRYKTNNPRDQKWSSALGLQYKIRF